MQGCISKYNIKNNKGQDQFPVQGISSQHSRDSKKSVTFFAKRGEATLLDKVATFLATKQFDFVPSPENEEFVIPDFLKDLVNDQKKIFLKGEIGKELMKLLIELNKSPKKIGSLKFWDLGDNFELVFHCVGLYHRIPAYQRLLKKWELDERGIRIERKPKETPEWLKGEETALKKTWGTSARYLVRREMRLKQARKRLRKMIKKHKLVRMMTLTFQENITDVSEADKYFEKFKKRLRRACPYAFGVGVREFQKRGAVHYHFLVNEYVDQALVAKLWGAGFVSMNYIGEKNAVRYVTKYLEKQQTAEDERLHFHRAVLKLGKLRKPEEVQYYNWDQELCELIADSECELLVVDLHGTIVYWGKKANQEEEYGYEEAV